MDVREMIKNALSLDAHELVESNNGAEALMKFAADHFDLVVTDQRMPFMTGSELAKRIKKMEPSQPILMITGHDADLSPGTPVDALVKKPFAVGTLRSDVTRLLSVPELAAA